MTSPSRREVLGGTAWMLLARRAAAMPLSAIRLGVTTDEIDDDVPAAAKFLKQHGLKWAEVRNIWGRYNTDQPMEKIDQARDIFDESGVSVSVVDTAFFRIAIPPEGGDGRKRLDEQWALLDRSLERARAFGTRTLRIFTFLLGPREAPTARNYGRIYELASEAARRARGFRLAVENIGGGHIATGAQAGELLKHVKEENFGILWDPNNAGQSGEQAYPDGYRKLDPARIFHVHLRDYKRRPDGKVEWTAVGQGEFDNAGQIRALLKDGYKGAFTLETHWRDPKGKMYSTETSLKGLVKVIGQV